MIDFAEEDIPDDLYKRVGHELTTLQEALQTHLSDQRVGERIRSGFRIALSGAPNVGKSSLINALARRDVAIVSDIAGTTRDIVEAHLDLNGYAVTVVDTAGLRDTDDVIEREGVSRARAAYEDADVKVLVLGATDAVPQMTDMSQPDLVLVNKSDLSEGHEVSDDVGDLRVSAKTGDGIGRFVETLSGLIGQKVDAGQSGAAPITRLRHREGLTACQENIAKAANGFRAGLDAELVAEDCRQAAQALGRITGRLDVEDILDKIFRDFCIGK